MRVRDVEKSPGGSWHVGPLARGCQLCMQGAKGVLFLTGQCQFPPDCAWYCPLSLSRKGRPAGYIDELPLGDSPEATIRRELSLIDALGMSVTGGDPLFSPRTVEATLRHVRFVKAEFGADFHVHLYTNGLTTSRETCRALHGAGLDEIRFHVTPRTPEGLAAVALARAEGIVTGVEIPALPTPAYQTYLLDELLPCLEEDRVAFLNLNELEVTETNADGLRARGFAYDWDTMASVEGTGPWVEAFFEAYLAAGFHVPVHFCPISLKDGVQARNRYRRRARNVARSYESVTEEGLLLRGVVTGPLAALQAVRTLAVERGFLAPDQGTLTREGPAPALLVPPAVVRHADFLAVLGSRPGLQAGIQETLPLDSREVCEYTPLHPPASS